MDVEFTVTAWKQVEYWKDYDRDTVRKIKELLKAIRQNPFKGTGKPEPLKHGLKGYWSRRISHEHNLVYKVIGNKGVDQKCIVIQCRYHYDD